MAAAALVTSLIQSAALVDAAASRYLGRDASVGSALRVGLAAAGRPLVMGAPAVLALCAPWILLAVAMGARDEHTLKCFLEAEAYPGPSIIIAYSHCIAHGIRISTAMQNQKAAVDSGHKILYRYHPERTRRGENPLQLDSQGLRIPMERFLMMENRFKMLTKSDPERARTLFKDAQKAAESNWKFYQQLASQHEPGK